VTDGRYERKFLAESRNADAVSAVVRRHPALFREVFPPRVVNNIYLDTPGRRDYLDHVNGAGIRQKSRVRWYGDPAPEAAFAAALEVKSRRGALSGKATYPLASLQMSGHGCIHMLASTLERSTLPGAVRLALQCTEPALVNRYHRQYFLSADTLVRVTVDSALEWFAISPASGLLVRVGYGQRDHVVVEVKYGPEDTDSAAAVTNTLPWRLTRFSKYVRGIDASRKS